MNAPVIAVIPVLVAIVAAFVVKGVFFPGPKWERNMRRQAKRDAGDAR